MKPKVLITGANGFLGSCLIKKLLEKNDISVYGIYRKGTEYLIRDGCSNLINLYCDLSKQKPVLDIFQRYRFDFVIHTAASTSKRNDFDYLLNALRDNVMSQANLVGAALKCNCKKFVYCSTISVYDGLKEEKEEFIKSDLPRPSSVYGWSKYVAEEILRIATQDQPNMKGVTLRMSGIHGSARKSGVVHNMIDSALMKKPIYINEPASRFRFLFLNDAVQAVLLALLKESAEPYTCYDVSGEEIITLEELAHAIFRITGHLCRVGQNRNGRVRNRVLDINKIKTDLRFVPRTLNENLTMFIDEVKRKNFIPGA